MRRGAKRILHQDLASARSNSREEEAQLLHKVPEAPWLGKHLARAEAVGAHSGHRLQGMAKLPLPQPDHQEDLLGRWNPHFPRDHLHCNHSTATNVATANLGTLLKNASEHPLVPFSPSHRCNNHFPDHQDYLHHRASAILAARVQFYRDQHCPVLTPARLPYPDHLQHIDLPESPSSAERHRLAPVPNPWNIERCFYDNSRPTLVCSQPRLNDFTSRTL